MMGSIFSKPATPAPAAAAPRVVTPPPLEHRKWRNAVAANNNDAISKGANKEVCIATFNILAEQWCPPGFLRHIPKEQGTWRYRRQLVGESSFFSRSFKSTLNPDGSSAPFSGFQFGEFMNSAGCRLLLTKSIFAGRL
jgi:hypothetical protein